MQVGVVGDGMIYPDTGASQPWVPTTELRWAFFTVVLYCCQCDSKRGRCLTFAGDSKTVTSVVTQASKVLPTLGSMVLTELRRYVVCCSLPGTQTLRPAVKHLKLKCVGFTNETYHVQVQHCKC